jgi:serine/threonine protein kinase
VDPLEPGEPERIGPHRLLGRLGSNSIGQGYLGRSPTARLVAVTVVHEQLARDPELRNRLRSVVQTVRETSAPFAVPVTEADLEAQTPWLVTGYLDAPSLARMVAERAPLPADVVRELAKGLCEALTSLHDAGVVHGDLTPSNVLMSQHGPRLINAGIARALNAADSPGYTLPQRTPGQDPTPAADVYALGAVLCFAATGHPPGSPSTLAAPPGHPVPEQRGLSAVTDPVLRDLIASCLTGNPTARPTIGDLLERLNTQMPATPDGYSLVTQTPFAPPLPPPLAAPPAFAGQPPLHVGTPDRTPTTAYVAQLPQTRPVGKLTALVTRLLEKNPAREPNIASMLATHPTYSAARIAHAETTTPTADPATAADQSVPTESVPSAPTVASPPGGQPPAPTFSLPQTNQHTAVPGPGLQPALLAGIAIVCLGLLTGPIIWAASQSGTSINAASAGNGSPATTSTPDTYQPYPSTSASTPAYAYDTPSPSPAFDPNTLNDSTTDQTPLTAAALLPQTFTDSKGVRYLLVASGQASCIEPDMSNNVQNVLSADNCTASMTGAYLVDSGTVTADTDILVSVQIFPFNNSTTAQQAYDRFNGFFNAGSWDFGFWCPLSGTGHTVCGNPGYHSARYYGSIQRQYRYVIEASAVYTNLSNSTSADTWTIPATRQAVTACGPVNYVNEQLYD